MNWFTLRILTTGAFRITARLVWPNYLEGQLRREMPTTSKIYVTLAHISLNDIRCLPDRNCLLICDGSLRYYLFDARII